MCREVAKLYSEKNQHTNTFLMLLAYCFIAIFSTVLSKPKKDLMSRLADCSKHVQSSFSGWTWKMWEHTVSCCTREQKRGLCYHCNYGSLDFTRTWCTKGKYVHCIEVEVCLCQPIHVKLASPLQVKSSKVKIKVKQVWIYSGKHLATLGIAFRWWEG